MSISFQLKFSHKIVAGQEQILIRSRLFVFSKDFTALLHDTFQAEGHLEVCVLPS